MATYEFTQTYNKDSNREELQFVIPKSDFEKFMHEALHDVSKNVAVPGFRKGHAPENQVLRLKNEEISQKAVNIAIDHALKSITKLEPQPLDLLEVRNVTVNDSGDMILVLGYIPVPEVTIGNYAEASVAAVEPKKTDDKEVLNEVKNVWHFYAKKSDPEVNKEDFSEEKVQEEFFSAADFQKDYPDIKNIEDLKKFLEDYINQTYEVQAQQLWENNVVDALIKKTQFSKEEPLIEKELDKRIENYKSRFTQIGMNAEEYMEKNNINEADLRKDWREQAERDVKLELILQRYGQENNIAPSEEEVEEQVKNLDETVKSTYKNNPEYLRSLVRYYSVNQKSYNDILEKIAPKKEEKKKSTKK